MESRKCNGCKVVKPYNEFHRNKAEVGGISYTCKECANSRRREFYGNNRESQIEASRSYRASNPNYASEYSRGKWARCKDEMRASRTKYSRERFHRDPVFKLKHSLLTQLRKAVTGVRAYSKTSRLYRITGLTCIELINHMHSTFEEEYGLGRAHINWKEVQIDHIIPTSTAKTEDQIKRLNHYSNLRLLYKEDNIAKRKADICGKCLTGQALDDRLDKWKLEKGE